MADRIPSAHHQVHETLIHDHDANYGPDCDRLASLPCPPQLHIAFGTQADGVEGFCLSYREAMLARRISRRVRGRAATTTFSAVALDVLATHDPEAARSPTTTTPPGA